MYLLYHFVPAGTNVASYKLNTWLLKSTEKLEAEWNRHRYTTNIYICMKTPGIAWPLSPSLFKLLSDLPEDCAFFFKPSSKLIFSVSYRFVLQVFPSPILYFWLRFQSFCSPNNSLYYLIQIVLKLGSFQLCMKWGNRSQKSREQVCCLNGKLKCCLCMCLSCERFFCISSHLPLPLHFTLSLQYSQYSLCQYSIIHKKHILFFPNKPYPNTIFCFNFFRLVHYSKLILSLNFP